jgi:hypothetical protein
MTAFRSSMQSLVFIYIQLRQIISILWHLIPGGTLKDKNILDDEDAELKH